VAQIASQPDGGMSANRQQRTDEHARQPLDASNSEVMPDRHFELRWQLEGAALASGPQ